MRCYCKIEARVTGVIWETVLSLLPDELAKALEASIHETKPDNDAIKAVAQNELVPGAEVCSRWDRGADHPITRRSSGRLQWFGVALYA
jgi:hypothetical protein